MEERSRKTTTTTTATTIIHKDNMTRMGDLLIIKCTGSLLAQCCLLSSLFIASFIIKFGSCGSFNGPFTQTNQYIPTSATLTSTTTTNLLNSQHQLIQKCSTGPPLQWRPYLDAASKAHLAPIVVLGLLQDLNLTPIELTTPTNQFQASLLMPLNQQQRQQQLAYHPQNINNIGVNIEATFIVTKILKKSLQTTNLKVTQTIKLIYKVSASLSTTKDLMTLINHNENSTIKNSTTDSINNEQQSQSLLLNNNHLSYLNQLATQRSQQQMAAAATCSLDLSEHELVKKGSKIFKLNQNYVLFLDQNQNTLFNHHPHPQHQQQHHPFHLRQTATSPHSILEAQRAAAVAFSGDNRNLGGNYQLQHLNTAYKNLQVGAAASPYLTTATAATTTTTHDVSLHPFATHELLTNQTSRALRKILCKNCAQVPQVQLLNSTFVQQQEQPTGSKIKLDCRVTGYPTPWIEWFRNGKLLRNKSGKLNIRNSKWKKRYNVRLSRLEIIPQVGKNDTGVYECRAMNVVAREPVVGAYTVLVMPTNYAIIPMQPSLVASSSSSTSTSSSSSSSSSSSLSSLDKTAATNGVKSKNKSKNNVNETTDSSSEIKMDSNKLEDEQEEAAPAVDYSGKGRGSNTSPPTASVTRTTPTTVAQISNGNNSNNYNKSAGNNTAAADPSLRVVYGPCQGLARDYFCLNKGTCKQIAQIAEPYCFCPDGYEGRRCEWKTRGHQQATG